MGPESYTTKFMMKVIDILPLDKVGDLIEGGDTSSWYNELSKTDTGLGCSGVVDVSSHPVISTFELSSGL